MPYCKRLEEVNPFEFSIAQKQIIIERYAHALGKVPEMRFKTSQEASSRSN